MVGSLAPALGRELVNVPLTGTGPNAGRTSGVGAALAAGSAHDLIEEMAAGAVLGLDDPHIGIETNLAHQISLDIGLRCRLRLERGSERAIGRLRLVERRLRRRRIEIGRA